MLYEVITNSFPQPGCPSPGDRDWAEVCSGSAGAKPPPLWLHPSFSTKCAGTDQGVGIPSAAVEEPIGPGGGAGPARA